MLHPERVKVELPAFLISPHLVEEADLASRAPSTLTGGNDLEEAPLVAHAAFGAVRRKVGIVEVVARVRNDLLAPIESGTGDRSVKSPCVGPKQVEG